jgi:hypothetical protein
VGRFAGFAGLIAFHIALQMPVGQGISWPTTQVLPRFAAYTALDVADISGLAFDRKVAVTVLQGLVNRSVPRIYLLDGNQSGEGKTFWIDRTNVAKTTVANYLTLFTKYRSEITGLCVYNPAVMGTVNAAVTAAGVTGCVVASPTLATTLTAAPYNIPITLDLRNLGLADNRAAFTWAKNQYWPQLTHRMVTGMSPGVHYPLFDYIVANRALCVWLDPAVSADVPLLNSIFTDMPVNGVYLGWWAGETGGVSYASSHGVMTFASDWFANATVHSGGSATLTNIPTVVAPPALANKVYIALIMSDGDNLQEQEHLFPIRWASTQRGQFPLSWTQSPALADFAPAMLNYYYATRTANDCFITGPSGVGYVLPVSMNRTHIRAFAGMTDTYLRKTGIGGGTMWGNSAWASDSFGVHTTMLGMANHIHHDPVPPVGLRYWAGGIPSLDMTPDYASLASQAVGEIGPKLTAWNRTSPLFIASQLNTNVAGLDQMRIIYDTYRTNPDVVFVRADQLFQLMRMANPTPIQWARKNISAPPLALHIDFLGRLRPISPRRFAAISVSSRP